MYTVSLSSLLLSALASGLISACLAYKRGQSPYRWFAIGFIFGIFGIFALFFTSGNQQQPTAISETKLEPVFSIHGPTDKFWYYLDPTQQQQGPMSRDALSTAWKEGKVDASTLVWHEELTDWKPLKEMIRIG